MAVDQQIPELSRAELDLMKILWRTGQARAREVHGELGECYDWAYSTTRTMLDRMVGKGYLARESFHGVNLYRPLISRPRGLARLVLDFSRRVLETDPSSVIALFADGSALSDAEVEEISDLIDHLDRSEP